jgi:hypothetical protein
MATPQTVRYAALSIIAVLGSGFGSQPVIGLDCIPFAISYAQKEGQQSDRAGSDINDETPLPSDPTQRAARLAKNLRYNRWGPDLTIERKGELFIEQIWPRGTPWIPMDETKLALVGRVLRTRAYLSVDRSNIYTEYTITPEEVLKADGTQVGDHQSEITIDRPGGILRLSSGKVVECGPIICYLGYLRTGNRYVVFARASNGGKDLEMFKGYELRGGQVLRLDQAGDKLPSEISEEEAFLSAARRAVSASHMKPNRPHAP